MSVYYNENDPYAAQWLENLIAAGHLPKGVVDRRSIVEVQPDDLRGFVQCHFFAGIGGWPLALRMAGWHDDRPVWTGSCPCQTVSSAARGRNVAPDMWPAWCKIIAASRPGKIFGEQIAQADRWIDRLCADMEALEYEITAAILPAVSVGQDHIRYRFYFAGNANGQGQPRLPLDEEMGRLSRYRSNGKSVVPTNGFSRRMAVMRAFGNAILPQVAAEFIRASVTG